MVSREPLTPCGHWLGLREDFAFRNTYCSGSFPSGQSTGAASSGGLGDRQERHMRPEAGQGSWEGRMGRLVWGKVGEGRQEAAGAAEGETAGLCPLKSSGISVF